MIRSALVLLSFCFLLSIIPQIASFPAYRDVIPNGLNLKGIPAIGHVNSREGGSELNNFGSDFMQNSYSWTTQLCQLDSDGDGQTNGEELGDPCCTWKYSTEEVMPQRSFWLSHPGDPESVSQDLATCAMLDETPAELEDDHAEQFWDFYWKGNGGGVGGGSTFTEGVMELGHALVFTVMHPITTIENIHWWINSGNTFKNLCTVFIMFIVVLFIWLKTIRTHVTKCTVKEQLALLIVAIFFIDFTSCFLHITLDNPKINDWPLLGPEAEAFQGHHYDPSGITRHIWKKFFQDVHVPVMAIIVLNSYALFYPITRMFVIHCIWMCHVLMASHRWSHQPPQVLPSVVLWLERNGLLLSTHAHSFHHATYDNNFAIFIGWVNPTMNILTKYFISDKNIFWVFFFFFWISVPGVISVLAHKPRFRRKMENALNKVSAKIALKATGDANTVISEGVGLCRVLGIILCVWITIASCLQYGFDVFVLHPVLLSVGVLYFLSDEMLFEKARKVTIRHTRHVLSTVAAVLAGAGTLAILAHKFNGGYSVIPSTLHAWLGVQCVLGMGAKAFLHRRPVLSVIAKRRFDAVLYVLCIIVCALGASKIFEQCASGSLWIWMTLFGFYVIVTKTQRSNVIVQHATDV